MARFSSDQDLKTLNSYDLTKGKCEVEQQELGFTRILFFGFDKYG